MEVVRRATVLCILAAAVANVLPFGAAAADAGAVGPTGSMSATASRAGSLYAKNDPWQSYLANERTCPGGERTDASLGRQQQSLACLVNWARRKMGLRPLEVIPTLSRSSALKARDIARCEHFAHDPCGGDWTSAVRSTRYQGAFGENLYMASGRWAAPRVAVDAWLNSAVHRKNMFGRHWREQGVALLAGKSFGAYRDVSVWVIVLGG